MGLPVFRVAAHLVGSTPCLPHQQRQEVHAAGSSQSLCLPCVQALQTKNPGLSCGRSVGELVGSVVCLKAAEVEVVRNVL